MKTYIPLFMIVLLIFGCIPQYQITQDSPKGTFYDNQNRQGVILDLVSDSVIIYKNLAKRVDRKDLQLIMFRIENSSNSEIIIDHEKIQAISTTDLNLIPVLTTDEFYTKIKFKPFGEILFGLFGGAGMFIYSSFGITFNPWSPTWLLTVGAPFVWWRKSKINKKLLYELKPYNLQGEILLPGESKVGIIALKMTRPIELLLRYSSE